GWVSAPAWAAPPGTPSTPHATWDPAWHTPCCRSRTRAATTGVTPGYRYSGPSAAVCSEASVRHCSSESPAPVGLAGTGTTGGGCGTLPFPVAKVRRSVDPRIRALCRNAEHDAGSAVLDEPTAKD